MRHWWKTAAFGAVCGALVGCTHGDTSDSVESELELATATFVSDLPFVEVANGWGPVERDRSNGEEAAGDGVPIRLAGTEYARGLGVHSLSQIDVPLGGAFTTFKSAIGVDDEVGSGGSVIFEVKADGQSLYKSPLMTGASRTKRIQVDVTGKSTLSLFVYAGEDGGESDHADWANARLVGGSGGTAPATDTPPSPTTAGGFLQANGQFLEVNGTRVLLKGTNFDNINALGANIGTNNVEDITFTDFDYAELEKHGGNHARLGLSFSWYKQNKTRFFQKMDEQVALATKHGIWLLFNMFTTPGDCYEGYGNSCPFWGNASEQQQLQAFWVEMATRYKNQPAVAGYDLLNEPTPPTDCKPWFSIAQRIYDAVSAAAPNQLVFVETCSDPGNDLKYNNPPKGKNLVYEVHDYSPMDMTHDMFSPGSVYPGVANEWFGSCYVDKTVMATGNNCPEMNIRESYGIHWASANNVPIYVGEWGAASVLKGYVQYTRDVAELFRDWGLNHAHYTWRHQTIKTGGFYQWGIYSTGLDDVAKLDAVKISWSGAVRPKF